MSRRRLSDPEQFRNDARESLESVFQKHLSYHQDIRSKRAKKVTQDEIDWETFKLWEKDLNYLKMHGEEIELTEMALPARRNNLSDLFFSQLSYHIIDALIEDVVEKNPNGLLSLFYKKADTRYTEDVAQAKRNLLIHYWAIRLWIQSQPKTVSLHDQFPSNRCTVPGYESLSMSYYTFNNMHRYFTIKCSLIPNLNTQMARWIARTPRCVCVDEKQKSCPQDDPLAIWAKKQDGHWTTEVACCAPISALPYVLSLLPITSVKDVPEDSVLFPFNNLPIKDIMATAWGNVHDGSIVLNDAYYSDSNYRKWARDNDKLYISAISKKRFPTLFKKADEVLVNKKGDFCVFYSDETEEHAMFYKSIGKKKKFKVKGVLTNAFNNVDPPIRKGYIPINQIKITYQKYFNINDRFNKYLFKRYFPYSRVGYEANYDTFFFATIQMNVFCLYNESEKKAQKEDFPKTRDFTQDLAKSLLEFIRR